VSARSRDDRRVAVVTGGASGIGLALVKRFAEGGWAVVVADIDANALDQAVDLIGAEPSVVIPVVVDVADEGSVRHLADRVVDQLGVPHVVCNNAGVNAYGYKSWEAPVATWQWLWGVNVMGVVHGISAFVPLLLTAGRGHVVNTASVVGLASAPDACCYAATKHAVVAISESLRSELAELGSPILVSVVCPGLILTNIGRSARLWPTVLGEPAALGPGAPEYTDRLETARAGAPSPDLVASAVMDALDDGRFLVFPDDKTAEQARLTRNAIFDVSQPDQRGGPQSWF
jgi:NAD(P)-dependent dehydrogenase (short-subunit alcohol dehydrogenase family)